MSVKSSYLRQADVIRGFPVMSKEADVMNMSKEEVLKSIGSVYVRQHLLSQKKNGGKGQIVQIIPASKPKKIEQSPPTHPEVIKLRLSKAKTLLSQSLNQNNLPRMLEKQKTEFN